MTLGRAWLRSSTAVAILFAMAARAEMPRFMQWHNPVTAKEAFATPYGQLMVDELAKALQEKAAPACLAEKKIAPADLRGRAEDLLVRYGQIRLDRTVALIIADKADVEFARLGGAGVHDEWRALLGDPLIAEYDRLSRAAKLVQIVDGTVENIDRYALLSRIDLRSVSPISTGAPNLNAIREETEETAVESAEGFRQSNDTPAVRRFWQLSLWATQALQAGVDQQEMLRYGPRQFMPGLDEDLRAVCIGRR